MKKLLNANAKRAITTLEPTANSIIRDVNNFLQKNHRTLDCYNGEPYNEQQFKTDLLKHLWNKEKEIFLYFNNDDYDLSIEDKLTPEWAEEYRTNSEFHHSYEQGKINIYLMID